MSEHGITRNRSSVVSSFLMDLNSLDTAQRNKKESEYLKGASNFKSETFKLWNFRISQHL